MSKKTFTLSFGITLFEDPDHQGPVTANPGDVSRFLAPYVFDIFKRYYPESVEDKENHWNYDTRFTLIRDFGTGSTQNFEFRDRTSGEIVNTGKYTEICEAAKEGWKNAVAQAYPTYDRAAIDEGLKLARFEYFPKDGLLVGFTLLNGLIPAGAEDFMSDEERKALQTRPEHGGGSDSTKPPENLTTDFSEILKVEYGDMKEIPFPEGTKPLKKIGTKFFIVTNGKTFGKRYGVVDNDGKIVLPVTEKHSSFWNGEIKYEAVGEKAIALRKNEVTLYSAAGEQLGTFKKLVDLGSDLLAVSNGDEYSLIRTDGKKVDIETYDDVKPFKDGVAIAKKGSRHIGWAPEGTVLFTLSNVDELRDFCNGYAVFRKGDQYGAIDKTGKTVLEAKYAWLRDSAFDAFVFSETPNPKQNLNDMGLVAVGDQVLVPCRYKNLEQIDAKLLKHGKLIAYQYTSGNMRYVKSMLAFGIIDTNGNEIVAEGLTGIGRESEGLRAYSRYYSDTHIEFGYMDQAWKSVRVVSTVRGTSTGDAFFHGITSPLEFIFVRDINDLLAPFESGEALVKLTQDGHWEDNLRLIPHPLGRAQREKTSPENTDQPTVKEKEITAADVLEKLKQRTNCRFIHPDEVLGTTGKWTKCRRVIGDLWECEEFGEKKATLVFSQLETTDGFYCGLLSVKDSSTKKIGFANPDGELVVETKYDEAPRFENNFTWARLGKQFFILKRDMTLKNIPTQ